MQLGISTLERAFQIARSGEAKNVEQLRRLLQREGYDSFQIQGRLLFKQLSDAMRTRADTSAARMRFDGTL
jgi:hypothetical protein